MTLKPRLKKIADMVSECNVVCDIGTDHAYIPIYLIKSHICKRAIATDIRIGPVQTAQRNIMKHGLEKLIETRIGNGLSPVRLEEIDIVIIAGMGGMLIAKILDDEPVKARKANKIVLQPMNAVEVVRKWLYENGYEITNEALASEGKKIYNIIAARWINMPVVKDEAFYFIGEKLKESDDPLVEEYICRKLKQLENILSGLKKANNKEAEFKRYAEIKRYIELVTDCAKTTQ